MYDRARQLFAQIGDRAYEALVKYNIAEILSDQGHHREAVALLREVIRQWRAAGPRRTSPRPGGRWQRPWRAKVTSSGRDSCWTTRGGSRWRMASAARSSRPTRAWPRSKSSPVTTAAHWSWSTTLRHAARAADGGSSLGPILARVRGWALLQQGVSDRAREAFLDSRRLAADRDDSYQVALALDGLVAAREPGQDVKALEAERLRSVAPSASQRRQPFPCGRLASEPDLGLAAVSETSCGQATSRISWASGRSSRPTAGP